MSGAVQSCKEVAVTGAKWQNADKISIACSSVGSSVYIKLDTKNFKEGDEIKVNIVDNTNKGEVVRENVAVKVRKEDNSDSVIAISDEIEVEKEWIFKELAIVVPKFIYEEDAERNISETELSEVKGSKLSVIADYLDVKIKVLDVRSNKPVANAIVKAVKIVDESGNTELLKTEFDHKETKLGSVSQSNTRSKLSIKALKSLLNKTDQVADSYDDKWKKAYKEYWNARIPDANIEYPKTHQDNILDLIIRDYNDQVATDSNGILTIHIPAALLKDKSARIEIGFWNFPVVKESVVSGQGLCRDIDPETGQANDTHFTVSWGNGTQSTEWGGNFNWIVSSPGQDSEEDGNNRAELKVSESFTIKDSTEEIFSIKPNLRSFLYAKDGDPHFILFAMEWCQPVWDHFTDPNPAVTEDMVSGARCDNNVFINGKIGEHWVRGLNMHMVSKCMAGKNDEYGHYYGFFDDSEPTHRYDEAYTGGNRPHRGVDIYSGSNGDNSVFAVHGGRLKCSTSKGYGNSAFLRLCPTNDNPCFHYAHLNDRSTKTYIMAGEIFGKCGRTGYNGDSSAPSHLHFELLNSQGVKVEFCTISSIVANMGIQNSRLFPGNKLPIVLPCMCHGNGLSTIGCNFGSGNKASHQNCWAVREFPYTDSLLRKASNSKRKDDKDKDLKNTAHHPAGMPIPSNEIVRFICPYILNDNANKTSQLQARLRFVIENAGLAGMPSNTYLRTYSIRNNETNKSVDTNGIDGVFGNASKSWVKAIIQTYQETLSDDHTDKSTEVTTGHAELFKTRYISSGNPTSDDSLVDGAYTWFMELDYTNFCYNTVLRLPDHSE